MRAHVPAFRFPRSRPFVRRLAAATLLAACTAGVCAAGTAPGDDAGLPPLLAALPVVDAAAPVPTISDLRYNSADPARIPLSHQEQGRIDPFALEDALMAVRLPVAASTEPVSSLSFRVQQSSLAACSQLCSFPMAAGRTFASNLMQFSCADDTLVRLREYPDPEQGTAFALARERVNVLVNGRPGWMRRIGSDLGTGMTILAWRGDQHGYSLVIPGAGGDIARRALAFAETLP